MMSSLLVLFPTAGLVQGNARETISPDAPRNLLSAALFLTSPDSGASAQQLGGEGKRAAGGRMPCSLVKTKRRNTGRVIIGHELAVQRVIAEQAFSILPQTLVLSNMGWGYSSSCSPKHRMPMS